MSKYHVFQLVESNTSSTAAAWTYAGEFEAGSRQAAAKKAAKARGYGTFVAVSPRTWKPMKVAKQPVQREAVVVADVG
jgi:hypothetical protein